MKIAALISQGTFAILTFVAFVMLPTGSYTYAWVPFVVLFCSVATAVALVRPFGTAGRWLVIALNCAFVLLSFVALVGFSFSSPNPRRPPFGWGVLAILIFALPYCLSILALRRQMSIARLEHSKHAA
jgi:hypothetical protein